MTLVSRQDNMKFGIRIVRKHGFRYLITSKRRNVDPIYAVQGDACCELLIASSEANNFNTNDSKHDWKRT